jgi:glycosyltransferase involved in cell wall biosynthesis
MHQDTSFLDDPLSHPLVRAEGRLSRNSSVLTVIPHFKCEPWLGDCLDSLMRQTRPPEGIVVIDDASGEPPIDIVREFPTVTLLESTENVGPYRLSQEVIANTLYDAYMFQDADDWSLPLRLELLLAESERTGAEIVSCMAYRLISSEGDSVPLTYSLDVNAALDVDPTQHSMMHPGSIVSRDLVMRVGGFATAFRFGGDTEFEHRAVHVARIVNIPQYAYIVRNRESSLTSSPETGLRSESRIALRTQVVGRAMENHLRVRQGLEPLLEPLALAEGELTVRHLLGPRPRAANGGTWPV